MPDDELNVSMELLKLRLPSRVRMVMVSMNSPPAHTAQLRTPRSRTGVQWLGMVLLTFSLTVIIVGAGCRGEGSPTDEGTNAGTNTASVESTPPSGKPPSAEMSMTPDESTDEETNAAAVDAPPGVTHTVRTADNMGTLIALSTGYTSSMSEFMLGDVEAPSVWLYPPSGKVQFIGVKTEKPDHFEVNTLGPRVREQHVTSGASFLVVAEDGERYEISLVDHVPGSGEDAHFEVRLSWL